MTEHLLQALVAANCLFWPFVIVRTGREIWSAWREDWITHTNSVKAAHDALAGLNEE